ncbi:MAG: zf-HC2 domain-containing protein [Opitutales bacterium]|nr:zf-HC2 domain-containing protein [Opitutales bacterium]
MNADEKLHLFLDDQLSAEEREQFEKELLESPELSEKLAELSELSDLHKASVPEGKSDLFIEQELGSIMKSIEGKNQKQPSNVLGFPNWLLGTAGVAAAAAFTVFGVLNWVPSKSAKNVYTPAASFVETDIRGASSMIFEDENTGWTIVWVDAPEAPSNTAAG